MKRREPRKADADRRLPGRGGNATSGGFGRQPNKQKKRQNAEAVLSVFGYLRAGCLACYQHDKRNVNLVFHYFNT
jgi:hypothetical protein